MLYYNIIILWDHRRICGPSLTETSLYGAYLYYLIEIWTIKFDTSHLKLDNFHR